MAITVTEKEYGWRQDGNEQALSVTYWVLGATGTLDAQRTAVMAATGIPAIGATRIASTVKCWSRTAEHLDEEVWQVVAQFRTEKVDDQIMNAASGTVVDRGFETAAERVVRYRSPAGITYLLGTGATSNKYPQPIRFTLPRLTVWFDRVHDSFTTMKAVATDIVGGVNSATWNGYPAGRWLCTSVNSYTVQRDSGNRYVARYEFQYDANDWREVAIRAVYNGLSLPTRYVVATDSFIRYKSAAFPTALTF